MPKLQGKLDFTTEAVNEGSTEQNESEDQNNNSRSVIQILHLLMVRANCQVTRTRTLSH